MERLPEAPPGLLKAQWQTFHGKAANLSDKSQGGPRIPWHGEAMGLFLLPCAPLGCP
jgi:hypothetical protein